VTDCGLLEITLHRYGTSHYCVNPRLRLPGSDTFSKLPGDGQVPAELDLESLGSLDLPRDAVAYGIKLTECLFGAETVRDLFTTAWGATIGRDPPVPLRLRLCIGSDASELHELHWELLGAPDKPDRPLAMDVLTPLSRYLTSDDLRPVRLRSQASLKALVLISNPIDLDRYLGDHGKPLSPVNVDPEWERARKGLGTIPITFLCRKPDLGSSRMPTLRHLLRHLRDDYDIVYLVCHGAFTRDRVPLIWLEDADGRADVVSADDMTEPDGRQVLGLVSQMDLLPQLPRLVVLAACESAGREGKPASAETNLEGEGQATENSLALADLGSRLLEVGVPAVVAIRGSITMDTVGEFMPTFFQELWQDGLLDRAMAAARSVVQGRPDWWKPVLLMRLESGQFFEAGRLMPFMVRDLDDYVRRSAQLETLRKLLLDQDGVPCPVKVGLWGFGGYGKTALARALCHELRRKYYGGVLWVSLGPRPGQADLIGHIEDLINELTGVRPQFSSLEAATPRLGQELGDRQALMVIDDVWNRAHLQPFLEGGAHCTRLITTRIPETLPDDAIPVNVGAMEPDEAVKVLGTGLPQADPRELQNLAARLGLWPILLKLANGWLRHRVERLGETLPQALIYANEALGRRGLDAFNASASVSRDQAVSKTVDVSLELLSGSEGIRYRELAIFPEEVDIPLATIQKLWGSTGGLDGFDTQELCDKLFRLSLLLTYDAARQIIRVHNTLRRYMEQQLADPANLHGRLLHALERARSRPYWHTLPDDGYILGRLTWHMEQAKMQDALYDLLQEQTSDGRNGWYDARERLGQTAGYLADVSRAWRLAGLKSTEGRSPRAIGLQSRCALLIASVTSMADRIPTELLGALVEFEVWTQPQGLAWGRRVTEPGRRAEALVRLAPHLPDLLMEVLAAAREIEDRPARVRALTGLAPYLSAERKLQVLGEALALAQDLEDDRVRVAALMELAPYLAEALMREALGDVLAAVLEIGDDLLRARTLARLAPHLPAELVAEVLLAEGEMQESWARGVMQAGLAPHLPSGSRAQALEDAVEAVAEIGYGGDQAEALAGLAPHLPRTLVTRAWETAGSIPDEKARARALAELMPCLPDASQAEACEEALDVIRKVTIAQAKGEELIRLIPHVPEALLSQTVAEVRSAAQEVGDDWARAELLTKLLPHLQEDIQRQVLQDALTTAGRIGDGQTRATILANLAPCLPAELQSQVLRDAFAAARVIGDGSIRVRAVVGLAASLPGESQSRVLRDALAMTRTIADERARVDAMLELALHLPQELLAEVEGLESERERERILAVLALQGNARVDEPGPSDESAQASVSTPLSSSLPREPSHRALEEALEVVLRIRDAWSRAEELTRLAPHLGGELLQEVLAAASAIEYEEPRAQALAALAPYLSEDSLEEALATARGILDEEARSRVLAALAFGLPEARKSQVMAEALTAAQEIRSDLFQVRARVLLELVPHLGKLLRARALGEAITAARRIGEDGARAKTLMALVPHLPGPWRSRILREALESAREIGDQPERTKTLAQLSSDLRTLPSDVLLLLWEETLPVLAGHIHRDLLADLEGLEPIPRTLDGVEHVEEARPMVAGRTRWDLLADLEALEPILISLGGVEAVEETIQAIQDVGRWWP
jgi:hypothetical protein